MLGTMRNFAKGYAAKTLLLALVISFGIWGIGDIFRMHSGTWLARVGDEHILAIEYANQRSMMRQAMASLGIKNLDAADIDNEVLRQMVQQHLVGQWLRDSGLAVNRATMANAIRQNRQFKDITGKFDKDLYNQILKEKQLSETGYLIQLRQELAGRTLLSSLDMGDSGMPESLHLLELAVLSQTRDALLVPIPLPTIDPASLDPAKLTAYYELHKNDTYLEPERRTLEYVTLDQADISALIDASITDSMLQDRYEQNKTIAPTLEAARPELLKQLRSEQHDVVVQKFSANLEDALAAGSAIGEAVAKAGVKAESKLLTQIAASQFAASKDALLRAVSAQGFALASGETSGLQSSENGRFFVVNVKEVRPAAPKPFDSVKGDVQAEVLKETAAAQVREKAQKAKESLALAKADGRAQVLAQLGLNPRTQQDISRINADEKSPAADALPNALRQGIFEHRIGEVAGPQILPDGSALLALVMAVHQPAPAKDEKQEAALLETYRRALSDTTTAAMFNALAEHYPVQVNRNVLDQLTQTHSQ